MQAHQALQARQVARADQPDNLEVMLRISDKGFADAMRGFVDGEIADSKEITPALHKKRATLWRRIKWAASYALTTTMDYTVTRRINFGFD